MCGGGRGQSSSPHVACFSDLPANLMKKAADGGKISSFFRERDTFGSFSISIDMRRNDCDMSFGDQVRSKW